MSVFFKNNRKPVALDPQGIIACMEDASNYNPKKHGDYGKKMPLLELSKSEDMLTEEALENFFKKEVIEDRLIFCPKINSDLTDGWGMFGYLPGFIFIKKMNYTGSRCINDAIWLQGLTPRLTFAEASESCPYEIAMLDHFDYFPRSKYSYSIITQKENERIFAFLKKKFRAFLKI